MTITIGNHGTSFVGTESVALFRLITMLNGLRFEVKTNGMKMCRGPSCCAIAKREFGLKGNREKVLAQLEVIVAEAKAKAVVVDERESAWAEAEKNSPVLMVEEV